MGKVIEKAWSLKPGAKVAIIAPCSGTATGCPPDWWDSYVAMFKNEPFYFDILLPKDLINSEAINSRSHRQRADDIITALRESEAIFSISGGYGSNEVYL